eukprot:NODE_14487_length_1106_cov_2.872319.p1 GENE.NODE_14487_length_1106_cov_2.872319~~NODE_14487_length_1106_cov_2.872319.p1  ORF type:complete len:282 (-),score=39.89 NODE_14487_length_1106_cov_2.872319:92-937(-)
MPYSDCTPPYTYVTHLVSNAMQVVMVAIFVVVVGRSVEAGEKSLWHVQGAMLLVGAVVALVVGYYWHFHAGVLSVPEEIHVTFAQNGSPDIRFSAKFKYFLHVSSDNVGRPVYEEYVPGVHRVLMYYMMRSDLGWWLRIDKNGMLDEWIHRSPSLSPPRNGWVNYHSKSDTRTIELSHGLMTSKKTLSSARAAYHRLPLIVDAAFDVILFVITNNMLGNTDFVGSDSELAVMKSAVTYLLWALTLYDGVLLKGYTFVKDTLNVRECDAREVVYLPLADGEA